MDFQCWGSSTKLPHCFVVVILSVTFHRNHLELTCWTGSFLALFQWINGKGPSHLMRIFFTDSPLSLSLSLGLFFRWHINPSWASLDSSRTLLTDAVSGLIIKSLCSPRSNSVLPRCLKHWTLRTLSSTRFDLWPSTPTSPRHWGPDAVIIILLEARDKKFQLQWWWW